MDLRVGLRLPACDRVDRVAGAAAYAEAKGFDSVWIPDSQLIWRDTFAALCVAATATSRITLAAGVTNVVYGTPNEIRDQVASLAEAGISTIITTPLAGDTTSSLPYEFMDSMAEAGLVASRDGG